MYLNSIHVLYKYCILVLIIFHNYFIIMPYINITLHPTCNIHRSIPTHNIYNLFIIIKDNFSLL